MRRQRAARLLGTLGVDSFSLPLHFRRFPVAIVSTSSAPVVLVLGCFTQSSLARAVSPRGAHIVGGNRARQVLSRGEHEAVVEDRLPPFD